MPDSQTRWSLADTHCVWCGKPKAMDAAFVDGQVDYDAVCLANCDYYRDADEAAEAALLSLRATVEAQGKVIQRLRDGWKARMLTGSITKAWWTKGDPRRGDGGVTDEPMEPDEQVVLYGKVVNEEAGDAS